MTGAFWRRKQVNPPPSSRVRAPAELSSGQYSVRTGRQAPGTLAARSADRGSWHLSTFRDKPNFVHFRPTQYDRPPPALPTGAQRTRRHGGADCQQYDARGFPAPRLRRTLSLASLRNWARLSRRVRRTPAGLADGGSAHPAGFEPTACRLGGGRSILLSYGCMHISQRLSIMARTGADVKGENVSFFLSLISTRICYDGVPINMKGRAV